MREQRTSCEPDVASSAMGQKADRNTTRTKTLDFQVRVPAGASRGVRSAATGFVSTRGYNTYCETLLLSRNSLQFYIGKIHTFTHLALKITCTGEPEIPFKNHTMILNSSPHLPVKGKPFRTQKHCFSPFEKIILFSLKSMTPAIDLSFLVDLSFPYCNQKKIIFEKR